MKRIAVYSLVLMGLNGLFIAYTYIASQNTPTFNCTLSTVPEALILSGYNWGGQKAVKVFNSWDQFVDYSNTHKLKIASYNFATKPTSLNVKKIPFTNGQVKITWNHPKQIGLLITPDEKSADVFYNYIRYNELSSSNYGFAIPVLND